MASKISINLDTSKENYLVCKCKQNDDLALEAYIYENGAELSLTNKDIIIQALKADNTYIIQNIEIVKENNKILAELDRDFSRVSGTTKIEILLVESGKQNTTFSFYLEVSASVIKGAVESSNTVTVLEALDNKIIEAIQVKEDTEQLIESGGAATTGDIANINAQLEQNTQHLNGVKIGKLKPFTKAMISFIFDDGYPNIYNNILPVFKSHGYKGAVAIYTKPFDNSSENVITAQQLLNYQNVEDWEILSHSRNHPNFNNIDIAAMRDEFSYSKQWLQKLGLKINGFVMPNDSTTADYTPVISDYYDYAFANPYGAICDYTKSVYNLTRIEISSYTLVQLEAIIDTAITNKQWIVFYGHDTTGIVNATDMNTLLNYIQSKNGTIEVLKPIEVMNQFSDMYIQENKIKSMKELDEVEFKPNGNLIQNPKLYMPNSWTVPFYWDFSKTGSVGIGERGTKPYRTVYATSNINGDTAIFSTDINVANLNRIIKGELSSYIYSNYPNKSCNVKLKSYKNGVLVETIIDEIFYTDFKNYKRKFSAINKNNDIDTLKLIITFVFDGSSYLELGFSEPAVKIVGSSESNDLKQLSEIKNNTRTISSNQTEVPITFENSINDVLGIYDSTNKNFKIKENGLYLINSTFVLGATTVENLIISVKKNGVKLIGSGGITSDFTVEISKHFSYLTLAYLNKDDVVSATIMKDGVSNVTVNSTLQITKL